MIANIDFRAIVLATLAVFGIDFITGIVLFSIFATDQIANASDEQVRAAAIALTKDPAYLRAALILGAVSTVVGGFLVARIARSIPYFNALAYGVIGVVLGVLTTGELPTWFRVVGIGLTVPASLLGAYFGKRPLRK
jgi:drug/metabolite transporter (DMT)-like permease